MLQFSLSFLFQKNSNVHTCFLYFMFLTFFFFFLYFSRNIEFLNETCVPMRTRRVFVHPVVRSNFSLEKCAAISAKQICLVIVRTQRNACIIRLHKSWRWLAMLCLSSVDFLTSSPRLFVSTRTCPRNAQALIYILDRVLRKRRAAVSWFVVIHGFWESQSIVSIRVFEGNNFFPDMNSDEDQINSTWFSMLPLGKLSTQQCKSIQVQLQHTYYARKDQKNPLLPKFW